jgi:outer membrane protein assembly factor BamB
MNKGISLLVGTCLIAIVVAAAAIFYVTNYSSPKETTPDVHSILWQTQFNHTVSHYIADNDKIFLTDKTGNVYGYNASTGEPLWKTTFTGKEFRPIIAYEDAVYIAAGQAVLQMNENTGHVDMQYQISSAKNQYQFLTVASFSFEDNKIVVNYDDQGMVFYDLASGQPLWSTHPKLGFKVYTTNLTVPKSNLPVMGYTENYSNIHAISTDNGSTVWRYPGLGAQLTWEDRVIVINYANVSIEQYRLWENPKEHSIVCINRTDGEKLWRTDTQYLVINYVIKDDKLLFSSFDGCYYSVNLNTGNIEWKTQIADLTYKSNDTELVRLQDCLLRQPLINADKVFWLLSINNRGNSPDTRMYYVLSIDRQTGEKSWTAKFEAQNSSYVDVVGWEKNAVLLGNHFFVNEDGKLLCLDSTGTVIWRRGFMDREVYPVLAGNKVVAVINNYITAYK